MHSHCGGIPKWAEVHGKVKRAGQVTFDQGIHPCINVSMSIDVSMSM